MLTAFATAAVCAMAMTVGVLRDPRRLSNAVCGLGAVVFGGLGTVDLLVDSISIDDRLLLITLVALAATASTVVAAGYLVVSSILLLRRHGRNRAASVSLLVGLAMVAHVAAWVYAFATDDRPLIGLLLTLLPVVLYLTGTFSAFLVYGVAYERRMRSYGAHAAFVVVLGSHLAHNRMTPELAGRLETALRVRERAVEHDRRPLLVLSGGPARPSARSEASVMAAYLGARGVPRSAIRLEPKSRSTEENLRMSHAILTQEHVFGEGVVVTSSFHAFRAALLMRRVGLPGQVVGAPTSLSVWPSAVIREFLAVLRDHRVVNALVGAACVLPLVWWVARQILTVG